MNKSLLFLLLFSFIFSIEGLGAESDNLGLSPEEKQWLAEHPVLRVQNEMNWPPYNFNEKGVPSGLSVDFMNLVADRIGVDIEYISGPDWSEFLNMIRNKEIDVITNIVRTDERQEYILFTQPYIRNPNIIVSKEDVSYNDLESLKGKKVAVLKGFFYEEFLRTEYPEVHRVIKVDQLDSLKAVHFDEVDACIGELTVMTRMIEENLLENLHVSDEIDIGMPDISSHRLGVRDDWPILRSILSKAQDSITQEEMAKLRKKWLGIESTESLSENRMTVDRNVYIMTFLLKNLGLFFLFMVILIFMAWIARGRPKQFSIRDTLFLISFIYAGLIVAIGVLVTLQHDGNKQRSLIEERKAESYKFAYELKQSSDDLTRFARLYSITGNPMYEEYFNLIIRIRDGESPRPGNYSLAFWDLVLTGDAVVDQEGHLYSMDDVLLSLGLSDEERNYLARAKSQSDDLISIENSAMNAVKGLFQDPGGNYSLRKEPDLEYARNLLHGDTYHLAKSKIMKNIDQFFILLEHRIAGELEAISYRNGAIITIIAILGLITIIVSLLVFIIMKRRIIMPLSLLEKGAFSIKSGDYSSRVEYESLDEIGALAEAFREMASSLEDRTARLRKLYRAVEQSPVTVVITDREGAIEYVNPKFTEVTGYTQEEALNQNPNILKSLKNDPAIYKDLWETILDGKIWNGEMINQTKSGREIWESISISPIASEEGEITHFVAMKEDITEKKETEQALLLLNQLVYGSLQSANVGAWWIDFKEDDIFRGLDKTGELLALDSHSDEENIYSLNDWGEILEKTAGLDEKYREMIDNTFDHFEGTRSGKYEKYQAIYPVLQKDGSIRWVEERANVQKRNSDGTARYMIGTVIDITELHKSQMELEKAKIEAEAATKAKGDFLANMSHEIRTPMNAIIGLSHLIQKTELSGKQEDYIQKIYGSAHNLLGIINDILDFSKIEAGKLTMESIDFDLHEVFDNLGGMIGNKAQDKGLELVFHISTDLPPQLVGDPLRLGQILLNLSNNAIKFTEAGEIAVSAELLEKDEEKIRAKFAVRDTGIGLTEEQAGNLFQAFSQADTSTTRKYGGTGLGLSISKKLSEMMNGSIGVESSYGEGSTFYFTAEFRYKESVQRTIIPSEINNLNVLIVDDNATSREVMTSYIEDFSFRATAVDNGSEAIQMIRKQKNDGVEGFDLVLMDFSMPGLNGFQTAEKINEVLDEEVRPKYILVTGYGRDEVLSGVDRNNFEGFVLKPVNQSLLFNTILQVYGHVLDNDKRKSRDEFPEGFDKIRGASILLTEDNLINQQVAEEILTGEGFFVEIAENGRVAIDKLAERDFDIVLMDLQMPVMDGYAATKEIRGSSVREDLPIVAMTADAMAGVRESVLKTGMNDYISKPIETDQLWATLAKWVKPGERSLPEGFSKEKEDEKTVIPGIEGVDISAGLSRVGGNINLYIKLLSQMTEDYGSVVQDLKELVRKGEDEDALRKAHSLKGVAGNLGIEELRSLMAQIEGELRDGLFVEESFDKLQEQNDKLFPSIKEVLNSFDEDNSGAEEKEIEKEKIREMISQAVQSLETRKPKPAQNILEELSSFRLPDDLSESLKECGKLLGKYKMKEAMKVLEEILESD